MVVRGVELHTAPTGRYSFKSAQLRVHGRQV